MALGFIRNFTDNHYTSTLKEKNWPIPVCLQTLSNNKFYYKKASAKCSLNQFYLNYFDIIFVFNLIRWNVFSLKQRCKIM